MDRSLRRAYRFFREHAGYVVGENAKGALHLAKAERAASDAGVVFLWEQDNDADWSWMDAGEVKEPHEVECCAAVLPCPQCRPEIAATCRHTSVLASLCGIFDADNNYRRVVEAELAMESLDEIAVVSSPARL